MIEFFGIVEIPSPLIKMSWCCSSKQFRLLQWSSMEFCLASAGLFVKMLFSQRFLLFLSNKSRIWPEWLAESLCFFPETSGGGSFLLETLAVVLQVAWNDVVAVLWKPKCRKQCFIVGCSGRYLLRCFVCLKSVRLGWSVFEQIFRRDLHNEFCLVKVSVDLVSQYWLALVYIDCQAWIAILVGNCQLCRLPWALLCVFSWQICFDVL